MGAVVAGFFERGLSRLSGRGQTAGHAVDAIEFLPATYPSKIMAIGRNYAEHASEGGSDLRPVPRWHGPWPMATMTR